MHILHRQCKWSTVQLPHPNRDSLLSGQQVFWIKFIHFLWGHRPSVTVDGQVANQLELRRPPLPRLFNLSLCDRFTLLVNLKTLKTF